MSDAKKSVVRTLGLSWHPACPPQHHPGHFAPCRVFSLQPQDLLMEP